MDERQFKDRTRAVALRMIRLVDTLPRSQIADVIGRQLLKASTSIGANYRSACRARSRADMLSKLAIAEEEADECLYWIELLIDAGIVKSARLTELSREIDEIVAMLVASQKTLRLSKPTNPKSKIENPKSHAS